MTSKISERATISSANNINNILPFKIFTNKYQVGAFIYYFIFLIKNIIMGILDYCQLLYKLDPMEHKDIFQILHNYQNFKELI